MQKVENPFMQAAIDEARQGLSEGGIPIGSVLVIDNKIVARGHNKRVQLDDPILHAEMDCLRNAGRIGSLANATLYSTLSPCYMCSGTVVQFKIPRVIFGEAETFPGAPDFLKSHGVEVTNLDLDACKQLMRTFIENNPELWNEDIGENE